MLDLLAGVPQGSILGPLLFLVFINDLADGVENMLVIFADDSNLSRVIPANEEDRRKGFESLQRDLHRMAAWARKWLVTFSAPKTKPIIFSKTRETRAARRFLRRNLQDRYLVSPNEDPSSLPDLWASNQEARPNLGPHALFEFCGIYLRESQTVTLLGCRGGHARRRTWDGALI